MARPLRIGLAGRLYHVTSRGDRREAIYRGDDDRADWLDVLEDVCDRFNWRCHAYCEMSNHYRFVVETPDGNLSKGMRQLNGVYTQHANRRHGVVGHMFQGRFKAILVEKDSYLLELSWYVALNPVRAGMVSNASERAWSSYRHDGGDGTGPELARYGLGPGAVRPLKGSSAGGLCGLRGRGSRRAEHLGRTSPPSVSRK